MMVKLGDLGPLPELKYLILSLKHSPGHRGCALWWGPNDSGYVEDINQAGYYTREQVEAHLKYYNDGVSTLAVIESVVFNASRSIKLASWGGAEFWLKKVSETKGD